MNKNVSTETETMTTPVHHKSRLVVKRSDNISYSSGDTSFSIPVSDKAISDDQFLLYQQILDMTRQAQNKTIVEYQLKIPIEHTIVAGATILLAIGLMLLGSMAINQSSTIKSSVNTEKLY